MESKISAETENQSSIHCVKILSFALREILQVPRSKRRQRARVDPQMNLILDGILVKGFLDMASSSPQLQCKVVISRVTQMFR